MSESTRKINPLVAAAAVAVIVFSAIGVGVMTGLIPSSKSSSPEAMSSSQRPSTGAATAKRSTDHQVVRMDNGTMRTFTFASAPGYAIGEKVNVIDRKLVKA